MIWYGRNDGTENGIGTNLTIQTQLRKKKKKKGELGKEQKNWKRGEKVTQKVSIKPVKLKRKEKETEKLIILLNPVPPASTQNPSRWDINEASIKRTRILKLKPLGNQPDLLPLRPLKRKRKPIL